MIQAIVFLPLIGAILAGLIAIFGAHARNPSDDAVERSSRLRSALDAAITEPGLATVAVYDSLMTIEAVGPNLTVLVSAPADVMRRDSGPQTVWATTLLPDGVNETAFVVDQGIRQTSASVAGVPGLYVVAAVADSVKLPVDEYRFYALIFCLAVVLLVLAGVTIFVEQQKLLERASFDPLTKLPNRGEFERRAANIIDGSRSDEGACLLLFDFDGFKQVNDTYGHRAGDEMLTVVASRLRKAVRDNDVVARWGGDEFVVVMPGINTEEMGGRRALELAEQIGGRTRLDGVDDALRIKVSVGVAVWPTHGVELDDLVIAADQAMYEAKRDGVTSRMAAMPPQPTATLVSTSA